MRPTFLPSLRSASTVSCSVSQPEPIAIVMYSASGAPT